MKIDGGCHCGAISYQAEVDPKDVLICHCTDCQTLSGSAFRVVVFANEADFKLLAGRPKVYVKIADSGRQRQQTFCPECGTPIYSGPVGESPMELGIRVGTVRQRAELVPKAQYFCHSARDWLGSIEALPKR